MSEYSFEERLAFSRGVRGRTDAETIKNLIPGCIEIKEACEELDKRGIDYIAKLRRGAEINIDLKTRDAGCSKYWEEGEPQIALELWSVVPKNGGRGRAGWTLDEAKLTDYTFHTFDPSDSNEVFLLPFQLLRMAFRRNLDAWKQNFKRDVQSSGTWKSECVFVPAWCVLEAIKAEMHADV